MRPLTLPGVEDACFDLYVRNLDKAAVAAGGAWTSSLVWSRTGVCSLDFGNGQGDISYVGPCDASGPGGVRASSVEIHLVSLSDGDDPITEFQNPCPTSAHDCVLDFDCVENRDVLVEINLTIMRDANQGFFDVAVNFEDVFCSAKLDTCNAGPDGIFGNDDDRFIELLHDGDVRGKTAVLALACTAGPGALTQIFLTDVVLQCGASKIALSPSAKGPGGVVGGNVAAPTGQETIFGHAIYHGAEDLDCGDDDCGKAFWNVAIGLEVDAAGALVADADLAGATVATADGCRIKATATAGDATPGELGLDGGAVAPWTTPLAHAYPIIQIDAPISGDDGAYLCVRHGLDGGTGGVRTAYTPLGATGRFCHRLDRASDTITGSAGCLPIDFSPPPTWTALSAYWNHACALGSDGSLWCWGGDDRGAATPPAGDFDLVSIGDKHGCAQRTDGTIACWGEILDYTSTFPPGPYVKLASGYQTTCGLTIGGSITCWGSGAYGIGTPPTPNSGFTDIAINHHWGYAVRTDGSLAQWGYNTTPQPQLPPVNADFTRVSAAPNHACGIRLGGYECWGNGYNATGAPSPAGFTRIASGQGQTCALDVSGAIDCWGANPSNLAQPPPGGPFTDLAAGYYFQCGLLTDGSLSCHANAGAGQYMGEGVAPTGSPFIQTSSGLSGNMCGLREDGTFGCWGYASLQVLPGGDDWASIAGGGSAGCGVKEDGTMGCWGYPGTPPAGSDFVAVSAGVSHACGLRAGGAIDCYGSNIGGEGASPIPNSGYSAVASGAYFSCALAGGALKCWGADSHGKVSGLPAPNAGFTAIGLGEHHGCALQSDTSIACWGLADHGRTTPPAPNSGFVAVAAGGLHSCGLKSDGTIVCWGDNGMGQLAVTAPNGGFVGVSAGASSTCGLKDDGVIVCWGGWGGGSNMRSRNPG